MKTMADLIEAARWKTVPDSTLLDALKVTGPVRTFEFVLSAGAGGGYDIAMPAYYAPDSIPDATDVPIPAVIADGLGLGLEAYVAAELARTVNFKDPEPVRDGPNAKADYLTVAPGATSPWREPSKALDLPPPVGGFLPISQFDPFDGDVRNTPVPVVYLPSQSGCVTIVDPEPTPAARTWKIEYNGIASIEFTLDQTAWDVIAKDLGRIEIIPVPEPKTESWRDRPPLL